MTVKPLTWTRYQVSCDAPGCSRSHEDEIRLDVPNRPDGWPEVTAYLDEGWLSDLFPQITAHFCPDHQDIARHHVPQVKRRRFFRWFVVVTTCSCGRMPEHEAPKDAGRADRRLAWLKHATGWVTHAVA